MSDVATIVRNHIDAVLVKGNYDAREIIRETLTYQVQGAEFTDAYERGVWDGQSSFFNSRKNSFPAGFVPMIRQALKRKNIDSRVISPKKMEPTILGLPKVDEFGYIDRYDFQPNSLEAVEKNRRGILQIATGGGKSRIARMIMAKFQEPTLFLTTRSMLLSQMKDAISENLGWETGEFGDMTWRPHEHVNLGMVQTFARRVEDPSWERASMAANKKKLTGTEKTKFAEEHYSKQEEQREETLGILKRIKVLIGEEAHEVGGDSYFRVAQHCTNAEVRVALTATPFMRDNVEDNLRLMGAFGPVLYKVTEKELIDRGILAKPYFKFVTFKKPSELKAKMHWQKAYTAGIVEAEDRNRKIVYYARKAKEHGLSVLVTLSRKSHGTDLQKMMTGLNVGFIYGDNDQESRKKALKSLVNHDLDVVIGTNILDVGVDVPALGMVILAGGGKAEVSLRQRIGRGLREKKDAANICFIVDFEDRGNKHLTKHTLERKSIVMGTPGFKENVLDKDEDFPWEKLNVTS